uniref:Uncharacterized protein n=1 Tax=Aegilops tauschii subsp. strangulata TaxID=200361 RepID=A0A453C3S5_AEGTS
MPRWGSMLNSACFHFVMSCEPMVVLLHGISVFLSFLTIVHVTIHIALSRLSLGAVLVEVQPPMARKRLVQDG